MHKSWVFWIFYLVLAGLLGGAGDSAFAQGPAAFGDPGTVAASSDTGRFVPVNPSVDGGTIPQGSTAQVVMLFRNETAEDVKTGTIRLYPSSTVSAQVGLNECGNAPLPAGAECAITITVKALQPGGWRVEMLMAHSARARLVTAALSGMVEGSGEDKEGIVTSDLEINPAEIDFTTLTSGQALIKPVMLKNMTSDPITIKKTYIDSSVSAGFQLRNECKTLNAGQACLLSVAWGPKLKGPVTGILVIEHSGPTGLISVPIKGEFTPAAVDTVQVFPEAVPGKGLLVSSQKEVVFGDGVSKASTITVSLVNVGDTDVRLDDIRIGGTDSGLSFKEGGCAKGTVLGPVEACPLTVVWSPAREGALLDDIQVIHNGARGILVLPVKGSAAQTVSKEAGMFMVSEGSGGPSVVMDTSLQASETSSPEGRSVEEQQQDAAADNAARVNGGAGSNRSGGRSEVFSANFVPAMANPSSVLDGLKITSFSDHRAIIAGPGGSRIVFDGEPIVLGGIPWDVRIQKTGIEFSYLDQKVLLLFDRSLSTFTNNISAGIGGSSGGGGDAGGGDTGGAEEPAAETPDAGADSGDSSGGESSEN